MGATEGNMKTGREDGRGRGITSVYFQGLTILLSQEYESLSTLK